MCFGKNLNIIQKPIVFDQQRIALTKEYRKKHYGITSPNIKIVPQIIALHWTDTATTKLAFDTFNKTTLSNRPYLDKTSKLNVSAHYLVARDGTVYQLMPDNWMSRSVIGLNNSTISIENIGGLSCTPHLTEAQLESNIALIKMLRKKYPTIHYLIGHHEYTMFQNTPLWLEKNKNYLTEKVDPGELFMEEVREHLSHNE